MAESSTARLSKDADPDIPILKEAKAGVREAAVGFNERV